MKTGFLCAPVLAMILAVISPGIARADNDSTDTFLTQLMHFKFHIDTRYSVVNGSPLSFRGGSVGYAWGKLEREVTLGYYWLGAKGSRQLNHIEKSNSRELNLPTYPRSEVGFFNAGYWHILHNSKRWMTGLPVEVGYGTVYTRPYTLTDEPVSSSIPARSTFVPLQLGGYVEWKATRWVGLGLQSGYRFDLKTSGQVHDLAGWYYRIRFITYQVAFLEGYNFVFKRKPLPSPFFKKE